MIFMPEVGFLHSFSEWKCVFQCFSVSQWPQDHKCSSIKVSESQVSMSMNFSLTLGQWWHLLKRRTVQGQHNSCDQKHYYTNTLWNHTYIIAEEDRKETKGVRKYLQLAVQTTKQSEAEWGKGDPETLNAEAGGRRDTVPPHSLYSSCRVEKGKPPPAPNYLRDTQREWEQLHTPN